MPTVTAKKQVTKCSQEIESLPLETFRLPTDGRKWKQAARSRVGLLLRLSVKANPDGTFTGKEGQNYARSFETLVLKSAHLSRGSYTRLTNALRDLGLLSWTRKNHYARREYTIHLPEHSPDSPKQYPDSESELTKEGENHYPHSPEPLPTLDAEAQNHYPHSSKSLSTMVRVPSLPTKERADKDFPTQTEPPSLPSAKFKTNTNGAGKLIQNQSELLCDHCGDPQHPGAPCPSWARR
jgi:hypothetical protein